MYSLLWFAFIGFCLDFASFVCHVILSLTFFFVILRFGRVYGIHINDDINDDNYAIDVIRDDELSDDEDEDDEDVYAEAIARGIQYAKCLLRLSRQCQHRKSLKFRLTNLIIMFSVYYLIV